MTSIAKNPGTTEGEHQDESVVVPVVEETAELRKTERITERVRVSTTVEEREQHLQEELCSESIEIERVPVGRVVVALPPPRTEGDVLIVPVVEERAVVSKELVVVEEVRIRKRREAQPVRIPVKLRSSTVQIEPQALSEPSPPQSTERPRR
jgi:stress response protein YsnF